MLAIDGSDLDPLKYPSIHKWKSTMKSYSASDMLRLVGVAYCRCTDFTVWS